MATALQKDALAKALSGKVAVVSVDTFFSLVEGGLVADGVVEYRGGDIVAFDAENLTEPGRDIAKERLAAQAKTKARRRQNARAVAAAYRGLGLTRTAYGWE